MFPSESLCSLQLICKAFFFFFLDNAPTNLFRFEQSLSQSLSTLFYHIPFYQMQTQSSILIKAFTLANTKPQVDQSNIIHEPFPSIRKNLEWLDTLIQAFLVYSKFLLFVQGYKSYSKNKYQKKGKKLKVYFISMKCHLTIAIQMANDTMILTTLNPCTLEHHWCSNQRSCKYLKWHIY